MKYCRKCHRPKNLNAGERYCSRCIAIHGDEAEVIPATTSPFSEDMVQLKQVYYRDQEAIIRKLGLNPDTVKAAEVDRLLLRTN